MNKVCPVITLDNGLTIANFSSPHPFKFTTGEVLPACDDKWVKKMSLGIEEKVVKSAYGLSLGRRKDNPVQISDIRISTYMIQTLVDAIDKLNEDDNIDIVLIPLMLMKALKDGGWPHKKCRCIRVADRITKEIYPDKFCI